MLLRTALCIGIPLVSALFVWLSPLVFVPVPWPDDSAFYFVARDLFRWPPRWVMLPQAPFEPSYEIWNFNTMPLYPILIGLGRLMGIDGSFTLKLWPLAAWAASGALAAYALARARLPVAGAALIALLFAWDPELRWSSVLVRPESLIALLGVALVTGLSLRFPDRLAPRGLWDPIAALLAVAAYAHFNAIHLVAPALVGVIACTADLRTAWHRLIRVAALTLLYLTPWIMTVALRPGLFIQQMTTQWMRLAIHNPWLSSWESAMRAFYQDMGSPVHWDSSLLWTAPAFALLAGLAIACLAAFAMRRRFAIAAPSAAWYLSSLWLWHTKPEVWFVHYIHAAAWTFAGFLLLLAHRAARDSSLARAAWQGGLITATAIVAIFGYVNLKQLNDLSDPSTYSWKRSTYHDFIDCISTRLTAHEAALGSPRPFRVWAPTFPDITIELSRRHPDWDFTRTNDFHDRVPRAIAHGTDVEAVVIPEMINTAERLISAPWSEHPDIRSVWLDWQGYYLHRFATIPDWKPNRYLCQRGRWQAFIFMR